MTSADLVLKPRLPVLVARVLHLKLEVKAFMVLHCHGMKFILPLLGSQPLMTQILPSLQLCSYHFPSISSLRLPPAHTVPSVLALGSPSLSFLLALGQFLFFFWTQLSVPLSTLIPTSCSPWPAPLPLRVPSCAICWLLPYNMSSLRLGSLAFHLRILRLPFC